MSREGVLHISDSGVLLRWWTWATTVISTSLGSHYGVPWNVFRSPATSPKQRNLVDRTWGRSLDIALLSARMLLALLNVLFGMDDNDKQAGPSLPVAYSNAASTSAH